MKTHSLNASNENARYTLTNKAFFYINIFDGLFSNISGEEFLPLIIEYWGFPQKPAF